MISNSVEPSAIGTNEFEAAWWSVFPGLAHVQDEYGLAALRAATVHRFPSGTEIIHAGDPCQSFVLLSQGALRVFEADDSGREIVLFRVQPGDMCVLTLSHLMTATPYSAGARAEGDVQVIMIPMALFQEALSHSDAFRTFVISTLSKRIGEVMALVEQVTFYRLDFRLAALLDGLFRDGQSTSLNLTHQSLALELGTTREVVSRTLKELERAGAIRLRRGAIELVSAETLGKMAGPLAAARMVRTTPKDPV